MNIFFHNNEGGEISNFSHVENRRHILGGSTRYFFQIVGIFSLK